MQLKARPCVGTMTADPPWLQLIRVVFTLPAVATALVYTNRSLAALLLLLLCLPAAADFYIVVSQDVVTVAVALEMHAACVGRDQHLCCLLFPPRHQHVCAFIPSAVRKEMMKWRMQLTLMHPTGMRKHVLATNVDWTETIHFQVWHVSSPLKNLK